MDERNTNIQTGNFKGFDFDYARERIKKAMDEKGCTQKELESALHISQSNISKGLSGSSFFSLDNFFRICDYLDLSMDEISGLSKKSEKTDSESLADLCSLLCKLNSIIPFETTEINYRDNQKRTALYFKSEYKNVVEMLSTISQINKIEAENIVDILETWEEGFKKKNKNRLKKYGFRNGSEYAISLLDNWCVSVSDICFESGYDDSQFESLFRFYTNHYSKEKLKLMYENRDKYIEETPLEEYDKNLKIFANLYEKEYGKE